MKSVVRSIILLACTAALTAQVPEAWRNWRYSAPVESLPAAAGQLVSVLVPAPVTARSRRDWTDLRVIDSKGGEVPFILHARFGGESFVRRPVTLLEPTAVEGRYQQVVADAGEGTTTHNALRLTVQTDQSLLSFVEVAVSTDLKEWRVVRDRAPIYVLRAEGKGEDTDVSYPESVSRYVRIRILEGSTKYALSAAEIGFRISAVAEHVPAAVEMAARTGGRFGTVWMSDGDAATVPMSRVQFQTTQTGFVRSVTIERSDDGDRWDSVISGEIRVPAGGERASLAIHFPEAIARHWRISVHDRSDAPIADLRPVLLTVPRRAVWRQEAGESYRLLFGHPRAEAPRYDLAQRTDDKLIVTAASATVGAEVENPAWVDPTPWTERYHAVLWVALVLAVLLLGVVAVRTLRTSVT